MAIPFSVILIHEDKKIIPLIHASLPPSMVMAHSHGNIIDSHHLWHFESPAESNNLVRIEYGPEPWFAGQHTATLQANLANMKNLIKDKTLWKFNVDGTVQPWMFVDGSLATVKKLCERLIDKHVKLDQPQKIHKLKIKPKPRYHNPYGTAYRFACLQNPVIFPAILDIFDAPEPTRLIVEANIQVVNSKEVWKSLIYNQLTKQFTIEFSPTTFDFGNCLSQLSNQVVKQAKFVVNPVPPVIPALG